MKHKNAESHLLNEFHDFANGPQDLSLPIEVQNQILKQVQTALAPSPTQVFFKLAAIHSIIGTLSLGICDQFGMNPFQTGFSLSNYFMKFGHSFCMAMCGFLFVGASILAGTYILNPAERFVLRSHLFLQSFSLSMISLGIFLALGAEIPLVIGFLWIVGGLISSQLTRLLPAKLA
ncbi:MAG: hypothetical protein BroJett040_24530 [Oligoflexia bacterium]|nr:MAG: hypothetical protein BroJett040_24530 [Oligoflexia bacterium]